MHCIALLALYAMSQLSVRLLKCSVCRQASLSAHRALYIQDDIICLAISISSHREDNDVQSFPASAIASSRA